MLKAEALNEVIHAGSLDGVIAQQGLQGLVDDNEVLLREQLLSIAAELEAKWITPRRSVV